MLLIGHHFWQTCNYHGALRSTKIYFTICNFNSVQCMFSSKSAPLFIFAPKENPYIFFIRRRVSIITMLFLCFHQCWWYELIDFFFYNYSRDKSEYVKWFFLNESETEYCIDNLFCDITTGHKLQINQIPYLSNYLIKSARIVTVLSILKIVSSIIFQICCLHDVNIIFHLGRIVFYLYV